MRRSPDPRQEPAPLVDWHRTGRRLGWSAATLGLLAVVAWLVVGFVSGGPELSDLGGFVGIALGGMFVVELFVVGGAALGAMLRAGERGDRLARGDVGLLPPQLNRRSGRRG